MIAIEAPITKLESGFHISCTGCDRPVSYATKAGALSALSRGTCCHCRVDYRAKDVPPDAIYKNADDRWCSSCPSCGVEQAYTRMDHAKTSHTSGWRCKTCTAAEKAFSAAATGFVGNIRVGWLRRFEVSAKNRELDWAISIETVNELWDRQSGRCALSGVTLVTDYGAETISLDRIDSAKGYVESNVQLVHKALNMMKRNMTDEEFIGWCKMVANYNSKTFQ